MLRVFINHYNPKASNAFTQLLPQQERQAFLLEDIHSPDLMPILQSPINALKPIHYSWISEALKQLPKPLYPIALSSLTPTQMEGLRFKNPVPVSSTIQSFIQEQLFDLLHFKEHLPRDYLPKTELTPLLNWNKRQILNLIDFLGLHDLAFEVRHIVNRNHLKNIYKCLTPKEFYYLKVCLHQKNKIVSPKLGLDPAHLDPKMLKKALHKRGLSRLGRALYGQPADLVWHLAHQLDTGRGHILLKDYKSEPLPKITPALKQQVINLINFLKSE